MIDSPETPGVPVDEGVTIIEFRNGCINWHGYPIPQSILQVMKEAEKKQKLKGEKQ